MMPTLLSPDMVGMPHQHAPSGAYTVDTILNELSRQLVGHTRQFSRGSNGPQRVGNAMRICKPRSANNSPRSSTLQTPRRRLVGDGFQGRLHTQFPAQSNAYLPTAASEAPIPSLYEPAARPARPVSWHPSSQHHAQQPLFLDQDASNAILYPQPAYNDAEMWASLQHPPPTPAMYSGYTSPVESFSPLSLPFSSFSSQAVCSPPSQPMPNPQQHQAAAYRPSGGPVSETPYPRPPRFAEEDEDSLFWQPYAATTATAINNAVLHRPTAPPTPEDVGYTLVLPAQAAAFPGMETRTRTQQQEHEGKQDTQPLQQTYHQHQHQPIIHDDDYDDDDQEPEGDGGEGEILYGMGLYDAPDHTKAAAAAAAAADPAGGLLHHQSVMFSLLGSGGGGARDRAREEASDTGRGLGLKLEDAWEPPASDDDDDDDDDEKGERDGEGEGQEEEEEEEE